MGYLIVILCSYLVGSSNLAYFVSRAKGIDLKAKGSGNLGASNATVVLGWYMGIAVAVHDILKAAITVWAAKYFFPELPGIGAAAGVSAVLGHIFPFYLRFRGGKGFASYLGMTIAMNWKLAIAVIALAFLITVLSDFIALGTITTVIVVPGYFGLYRQDLLITGILIAAAVVIICKHRENIQRILNHTEIGLRSTMKGEHRVKQ